MDVLGYFDRWGVPAGEALELKVSTKRPEFQVDIIRFDHYFSDPDPARDVVVAELGSHPGREQGIPVGSFASVPSLSGVSLQAGFTFQCWLNVGMVSQQGVMSCWDGERNQGFGLSLEPDGRLSFVVKAPNGFAVVRTETPLLPNRWYFVAVMVDPASDTLTLDVNACARRWLSSTKRRATAPLNGTPVMASGDVVLGAASLDKHPSGRSFPQHCLNGKIDRPACWSRALRDDELNQIESGSVLAVDIPDCLVAWDLAQEFSTNKLVDISGNEHHGFTVNLPMRAVVGANWDGSAVSIHQNPAHYGAIAFHEDDLEDCGWHTDLIVQTDPGWSSGIYAARLRAGSAYDYVPFYVRPRVGQPKAKVLFLAPTNTYLAYGNEKLIKGLWDDPLFVEKSTDSAPVVHDFDQYLLDHPELGSSIYDKHPDGSGVCYSSRLRPLLTVRPGFLMWLNNQARHFSADLYLIEWLHVQGIAYDVATDEDLHVLGDELLDGYAVVLTGGHPEYWTLAGLETLERYLAGGGKLMYLGGNGFYWVTGVPSESPHVLEVRRGYSGIRSWSSHPGELTLSLTGEQGGLWRYRGKTPNSLCGIGFASEGWGGAPGYVRAADSIDPRAAFVFEGIEEDEIIGNFGFVMGGAAGDEIDRFDLALGTPDETLRLATTELRHSDYYQLVVEDCQFVLPGLGGTQEPKVRSDITYLQDENGGAVFSVGSINWIGSLMWNDGKNNVSTMTGNVLRAFAGL